MRTGFRFGVGTALALALFAGDVATLSVVPASAQAAGYHGGGYHGGYRGGGYHGYRGHGGYHGYRGGYYGGYGFGLGDALLGAAIIGGTAAIISSANSGYDSYQTYPAPVYAAPVDGYAEPDYAPQPGYAPQPDYAPQQQGYAPQQGYAAPSASAQVDPVEQCSRAAERQAQSNGGFARVVAIDRVDPRPTGAQVRGTLEIDGNGRRATRTGFTCTASYGQIVGLNLG